MNTSRKTVLLCFGGRSVEHEISIVTALQVLEAMDAETWNPLPLYIAPDGRCWMGAALHRRSNYEQILAGTLKDAELKEVKLQINAGSLEIINISEKSKGFFGTKSQPVVPDIIFPLFHGTFGEDGAFQGMVEWAGLPCVGSGTRASAVGMDKEMSKVIAKANGVEVLPWITLRTADFKADEIEKYEQLLSEKLGGYPLYPLIIKPNALGSSIGVKSANNRLELLAALLSVREIADIVIIEPKLLDFTELNIAVMSFPQLRTSCIEQPKVSTGETVLTFEQKYVKGAKSKMLPSQGMASLSREIEPKWVTPPQRQRVEEYAKTIFRVLNCRGVARIDYLVANGQIIFNEINTIPGSLSHYLWKESANPLTFTALVDNLLEEALDHHAKQKNIVRFQGKLQVL